MQLEVCVFSSRSKFKVVLADCQTCECDLFLGEFVIPIFARIILK